MTKSSLSIGLSDVNLASAIEKNTIISVVERKRLLRTSSEK